MEHLDVAELKKTSETLSKLNVFSGSNIASEETLKLLADYIKISTAVAELESKFPTDLRSIETPVTSFFEMFNQSNSFLTRSLDIQDGVIFCDASNHRESGEGQGQYQRVQFSLREQNGALIFGSISKIQEIAKETRYRQSACDYSVRLYTDVQKRQILRFDGVSATVLTEETKIPNEELPEFCDNSRSYSLWKYDRAVEKETEELQASSRKTTQDYKQYSGSGDLLVHITKDKEGNIIQHALPDRSSTIQRLFEEMKQGPIDGTNRK